MYPVLPFHGHVLITVPYGKRGTAWASGKHNGEDYGHQRDREEVRLTRGGVVVESGWNAAYGWTVVVRVRTLRGRRLCRYAHLRSASDLRLGQRVTIGQFVGIMGQTGNAYGVHLHYMESVLPGRYGIDDRPPICTTSRNRVPKALKAKGWTNKAVRV